MSKKRPVPSRALTVPQRGTALANPQDWVDKSEALAQAAISPKTTADYQRCWAKFNAFCMANGLEPMPVKPQALILYFTWLVDGQPGKSDATTQFPEGYVISKATLSQVFSAIKYVHRSAGYPLADIMKEAAHSSDGRERKAWAHFKEVMDGARRQVGQARTVRRVDPVMDDELRDVLEKLRSDVLPEARDAALLSVGFGAALRRSEVAGLDYQKRGSGNAVLSIAGDGTVTIKFLVSKTNQTGEDESCLIPVQHLALLCRKIKEWIAVAQIKPGDAVFPRFVPCRGRCTPDWPQSGYRGINWEVGRGGKGRWFVLIPKGDKRVRLPDHYQAVAEAYAAQRAATGEPEMPPWTGYIMRGTRLGPQSIARMVKDRWWRYLRSQYGKRLRPEQEAEIKAKVARMSGHSLRAGFATSAARNGKRADQIQLTTRHKTTTMINDVYIRQHNKVADSAAKGMKLY